MGILTARGAFPSNQLGQGFAEDYSDTLQAAKYRNMLAPKEVNLAEALRAETEKHLDVTYGQLLEETIEACRNIASNGGSAYYVTVTEDTGQVEYLKKRLRPKGFTCESRPYPLTPGNPRYTESLRISW